MNPPTHKTFKPRAKPKTGETLNLLGLVDAFGAYLVGKDGTLGVIRLYLCFQQPHSEIELHPCEGRTTVSLVVKGIVRAEDPISCAWRTETDAQAFILQALKDGWDLEGGWGWKPSGYGPGGAVHAETLPQVGGTFATDVVFPYVRRIPKRAIRKEIPLPPGWTA